MADFHINKVPTFSLFQHENCEAMEEKVWKASAKIPVGVLNSRFVQGSFKRCHASYY